MFCRFCGKQIDDGAAFCPFCGSPVAQNAQVQQQVSQPVQQAPVYAGPVSSPEKQASQENVENKAPTKGLVFGILAFVSTLILFVVYRKVLFPLTYSGAGFSRMAGPLAIVLLTDLMSLVFIILNAVFGIMGMVRGIVKKKNMALGIVAVVLFVINFIFFIVVASRVTHLSNAVTNYWLNQLYW